MPVSPRPRLPGQASLLGSRRRMRKLNPGSLRTIMTAYYAVRVVTQHGSCDTFYNTKIAVSDGQVHATGHALLRASGHIGQGGAVSVTLRLLHHAAHFAGFMRRHSGSGKWSSASLACRGYWRATRQS